MQSGRRYFRPAMRDAAKAITAAIAANDSGGAQDKFAELNHEAGQRFLQVDKDLKALTDELRQLDGPLQGVVSAIRQAKSDA